MDKNTLSHYGWILLTVSTMGILLMLAQPVGEYVSGVITGAGDGLVAAGEQVDINKTEEDMNELFKGENNNIDISGK